MRNGTLAQIGPWAGILHVVLAFTGFFIHWYPTMGASGPDLVAWTVATDPVRFATGVYIEAAGYVLLLVFAAWFWAVLQEADPGARWLATAGLAALVGLVVVTLPLNEQWLAMLQGGKHGLDAVVMATLRDSIQYTFERSFLFAALFLATTAVVLLRAKALPGWIGWSAAALAVLILIPPATILGGMAFTFWIPAVSAYALIRRQHAPQPSPALAPA